MVACWKRKSESELGRPWFCGSITAHVFVHFSQYFPRLIKYILWFLCAVVFLLPPKMVQFRWKWIHVAQHDIWVPTWGIWQASNSQGFDVTKRCILYCLFFCCGDIILSLDFILYTSGFDKARILLSERICSVQCQTKGVESEQHNIVASKIVH